MGAVEPSTFIIDTQVVVHILHRRCLACNNTGEEVATCEGRVELVYREKDINVKTEVVKVLERWWPIWDELIRCVIHILTKAKMNWKRGEGRQIEGARDYVKGSLESL